MFEFFKDIILETQGIEAKKENKVQEEKIILKKSIKRIFYVFGIIYIITAVFSSIIAVKSGNNSYSVFVICKNIFLTVLVIACLINISVRQKTNEKIGIVLAVIFVILQFGSPYVSAIFLQ